MKSVFVSTVILCFFLTSTFAQSTPRSASVSSAAPTVDPLNEIDKQMTYGEDIERDKQSLAMVERLLTSDGNNYQYLWRLARATYFVGDSAAKSEKVRFFERGVDAGQRAVAREPNAAEGHFWLGVCYGGLAEEKGALKALSLVKKIRAEMETVLRLNDRYHEGNAYLALGEMDRQLPRIVGGSVKRSITTLEQGVRVAPNNLEMKFALANSYQEAGRKDEARQQLQDILGRQINPARAKTERDIQEKSRKLLSKL